MDVLDVVKLIDDIIVVICALIALAGCSIGHSIDLHKISIFH